MNMNDTLPWIEKYRPTKFEEMISHDTIISVLKKTITENKLQHLLFHGPPGTGKTSLIKLCMKELYGNKSELMTVCINASEARGIDVVREDIQDFVNAKVIHSDTNKSIFKLVILDEADAMTADAQAILRKVIENYSYCARFCLICNCIKKITPALQSRCACYRFSPLKPEEISSKIKQISELEQIVVTDDGIDTLIKRSNGDMRRVLNILQSTSMINPVINSETINECIGYPIESDVKIILKSLIKDDFEKSYDIIKKIKYENMYSLQDIITEVSSELILYLKDMSKLKYLKKITPHDVNIIMKNMNLIESNLSLCTSDNLQLLGLIGAFKIIKN